MRFSNIELCRIVAIFLVLLVHTQFLSLDMLSSWGPNTLDSRSLLTIILQSVSIICVNVFILISGYFSIQFKFSSFLKIMYNCFFCSIVLNVLSIFIGNFQWENLFFISRSNWFVLDYIGLMILSPMLNTFLEHCSKKVIYTTMITFLLYQIWFGWFPGTNHDFNQGYSILSFSFLYLLARIIKLDNLILNFKKSILMFFISTMFLVLLECFSFKLTVIRPYVYSYNNPLIIFSSLMFFYIFLSLKISFNKVINYIAKSSLTILLLHVNPVTIPIYCEYFKQLNNLPIYIYLPTLIISIICIGIICILIDQIRILSYDFFENRYISMYGMRIMNIFNRVIRVH